MTMRLKNLLRWPWKSSRPNRPFLRVERRRLSNAIEADHLEGRELLPGDLVYVRWPNGTATEERVRIDARAAVVAGVEGSPRRVCRRAFVEVELRGAAARVYLDGGGVAACRK